MQPRLTISRGLYSPLHRVQQGRESSRLLIQQLPNSHVQLHVLYFGPEQCVPLQTQPIHDQLLLERNRSGDDVLLLHPPRHQHRLIQCILPDPVAIHQFRVQAMHSQLMKLIVKVIVHVQRHVQVLIFRLREDAVPVEPQPIHRAKDTENSI